MEHGYVLSILYEMALVIGGEVSVKPLLTRTLQRLLYNTSFPAGFVCLGVPSSSAADSAGTIEVRIDAAVGDYELAGLIGQTVRLPAQLLRGPVARGEDAALLAALPEKVNRYKAYLRLPIDGQGVIVLLAPQLPDSDLPLTQLFQPVMANLAKAILLCSYHDAYTGGLIAARDASEEKFRAISAAPAASWGRFSCSATKGIASKRSSHKPWVRNSPLSTRAGNTAPVSVTLRPAQTACKRSTPPFSASGNSANTPICGQVVRQESSNASMAASSRLGK